MRRATLCLAMLMVVLALPGVALATNGMNMIGTGPVSSGMGGADVAVPAGCTAIAGNPAQLATTCARVISVGSAFLAPAMETTMPMSGGVDNEFQMFPLPFVGYAQRLGNSPWALGLGVFAQGGMGVDFQGVPVGPGITDSLYSEVAFLRFSPTVAYAVNDRLSLGLSAFIGYSTIEYSFFPNLMQGQKVTDLSSFTMAGRVGLSYKINEQWAVGLTYTSESALDFDDGEMLFNLGPQMGTVKYRDVSMENFTWPQQFEFGFSYRPAPKWLLAFDVSWINWSSAIELVKVKAKDPSMPLPPELAELEIPFHMNWKDQWVFAVGAQYEISDHWTLRAGYNYGKNPVPSENLNPLFPAIVEHHLTMGFTYSYESWDFDFAFEHAFDNSQKNDGAPSQTNPFAGVEVSHYQNTMHFMISYRF